jgi:hypothetical protein
MADSIWRVPLAAEVHSFEAEVSGDQNFFIRAYAQHGSVVADAVSHRCLTARPRGGSSANVSNQF